MNLTITRQVQFNGGARGRKRIEEAGRRPDVPVGRVPRTETQIRLDGRNRTRPTSSGGSRKHQRSKQRPSCGTDPPLLVWVAPPSLSIC